MRKLYAIWIVSAIITNLELRDMDMTFWISFITFIATGIAIANKWDKKKNELANK